MKKNFLRIIFAILLVSVMGLYVFDIVVNHTPFTKNLFRTGSIVCICVIGFYRVGHSATRRGLPFYESEFSEVIGNAFSSKTLDRKKLLCAIRLFDEGNYTKAIKYLTQLQPNCKTQYDYYAVWLFLGRSFTELQMYKEACSVYRQLINHDLADSRIHSNMGYVLSEMGEPDKAMSSYREALYLDKDNANTHVNIAHIYFSQREFDEAISWAQKALELNPKLHQAATMLAIIYSVNNQKELAEKYRHIALVNGQNPDSLKAAIQYYQIESDEES